MGAVSALTEAVAAVLRELPMSDDGTGHITDCGYTESEPVCRCYTLPSRIAAAVESVVAAERARLVLALLPDCWGCGCCAYCRARAALAPTAAHDDGP